MKSVPAFTAPTASVASNAENDLHECEVLLRRAIETVRGALRGPRARNRLADNAANAAELVRSAPVHPALPRKGRAVTRLIGRILITLPVLAVTGFVVLVLSGLQAAFSRDPNGLSFEADRARQGAIRLEQLAPAHGFQQGLKLVGVGTVGSSNQGMSVALSADGNTAVVGAPGPNNADRDRSPFAQPAGAAWVFTRSAGVWSKRGNKLVGSSSEYGGGLWSQGASVAVSADGKTAIVGGPSDNRTTGAAWVFTRSGGVWTQEGDKLVGTYRAGESALPLGQGMSVALSADGNTAIVGGWRAEGAWVFTRSSGVWRQQGNKLVGTGAAGSARQGMSVALSGDGNTAIVGGWADNNKTGAAWVFTRSSGAWRQEGDKLVSKSGARQGTSVALSADGNSALAGGLSDEGGLGATSVFTRSGGHWTKSKKLVGTGAMTASAVALSSDGSIALIGASNETGGVGAS